MSKNLAFLMMAVALVCVSLPVCAAGEDFQQTYRLGAGGSISISNISGDITVTGYDGASIVVVGRKEGGDRDRVTIEDSSSSDRVALRVRYPTEGHSEASVRFEVQVPRSVSYKFEQISSISGDVQITGVKGDIRVKSVSGDVVVKDVTGTVSASTVSGDVVTFLSRLEGPGDMEFSSVSGDVAVKVPADLSAEIQMSSMSGDLATDFPIKINEKGTGPGQSATGRIADGSRHLKLKSVSGDVSLKRL